MQSLKAHQRALLWAAGFSVAAWFVPILWWIQLPLEYLNAHTHELCHALVAVATGGQVHHINVFADVSGLTPVAGGMLIPVASAGYVGATLVGLLVMAASRTEMGAKTALRLLAVVLASSLVLWVRGDAVGVLSGVAWVVALLVAANLLKGPSLLFAAQLVAIQQCLTSLQNLLVLQRLTLATQRQSDATILYQATGIHATVWAIGWTVLSLWLVTATVRWAWGQRVSRPA